MIAQSPRFPRFALAGLVFVAGLSISHPGLATPPRVMALDGHNSLVADDWDVSNFDNVAPFFANHLYLWYLPDNTLFGWGIYEVRPVGTFTIWINRPATMSPLFQAAGDPEHFGKSNDALLGATGGGPEFLPREHAIGVPENSIALGWGRDMGGGKTIGLGFQFAQFSQHQAITISDTSGGPSLASGNPSGAAYILDFRPASTTIVDFENRQASSSIVLGPSFGIRSGNLVFDAAAHVSLNHFENTHHESFTLEGGNGVAGNITQTLKDDAQPSYDGMARLMVSLSEENNLVIQGSAGIQDLSSEHTVKGTFDAVDPVTGAGNWNHIDQKEILSVMPWSTAVGISHRMEDTLVVVGVGANGKTITATDTASAPKGAVNPDDIGVISRVKETEASASFPLILGAEHSFTSWFQFRAVA